ncbi:MAG: polymer-forming cytoskeletal protein [Candidatus Delongbacteria bacterium]|nr:polymer-forming cytoskeletal protein [Candidatus Delongbacteria bacterium]
MKDIKGLGDLVGDLTESNQPKTSIGPSIFIKGEISGDEFLSVEGRIEGKINLNNGIQIKKDGLIKADMHATSIMISGKVVGNIHAAEKIELMEDSKVIGDLNAPRIVINEGAKLSGQIKMEFQIDELSESSSVIPEPVSQPADSANFTLSETLSPQSEIQSSVPGLSAVPEQELPYSSASKGSWVTEEQPTVPLTPTYTAPSTPMVADHQVSDGPSADPDSSPSKPNLRDESYSNTQSPVSDSRSHSVPGQELDDHAKHRSSFIVRNDADNNQDPTSNKSSYKSFFKN